MKGIIQKDFRVDSGLVSPELQNLILLQCLHMLGREKDSLSKSRIKTNLSFRVKRDQVRQADKAQEKC